MSQSISASGRAHLNAGPRESSLLESNLIAIRKHLPVLCDLLLGNPPANTGNNSQPFDGPDGLPPEHKARMLMANIEQQVDPTLPVMLAGIGDGLLLKMLAEKPCDHLLNQQQAIYVVEPDPARLLETLSRHDYSGADGPIAQKRVRWFVGPDWSRRYVTAFVNEPMLLHAAGSIRLGPEQLNRQVAGVIMAHAEAHKKEAAKLTARIRQTYADRPALPLILAGNKRRPRVLLMTSRFSTVLQHSTRDAADAFRQLGWETSVLIESDDYLRITEVAILRAMHRFEPDLLFTIDTLRHQLTTHVPDSLPYVCWAQDNLPKLTNTEAGATIGMRDFILTNVGPMYARLWGYPARQIIETPKLTRVPLHATAWKNDGADLVYVSNASHKPEAIIEAIARLEPDPQISRLMRECGRRMIEHYSDGKALPTMWHVGQLLDDDAKQLGVDISEPTRRASLVNQLMHPLNNALYRQQALGWVADAAEQLGLSFELYGQGWEKHERFAPFARGPVAYGPDLEQLTRRCHINLQIIPSFCLHQRMLDGLVAGGFFVVRAHPSDMLMPQLAAFMAEHAPESAETVEQARDAMDADTRCRFDALLDKAECLADLGAPIDPVEWVRGVVRSKVIEPPHPALPDIETISFDSPTTLRRAIERFLHDEPARRAIAERQRQWVEQRLTYRHGIGRAVERIAALIADDLSGRH